jgi:hypothetical protein
MRPSPIERLQRSQFRSVLRARFIADGDGNPMDIFSEEEH